MSKTPNRDRAMQLVAKYRKPPQAAGTRHGNTFRLDLRGPVLFYGEKGPGIDADAVVAGLKANQSARYVFVDIDSEGGSMIAGQQIYAALRAHPGLKITNADRLCASSATLILMAGDFRTCAANTQILLHAPEIPAEERKRWTAARHSQTAGILRRFSAELVKTYAERTGLDARVFEQEIQHEDIMGATRARKLGLVHCLAGEERWINGVPYYFPDPRCSLKTSDVAAFSPAELQAIARKRPDLWRDSPIGYLAFAAPSSVARRN